MKQWVLIVLLGGFPYWLPGAVWGGGGDAEAGSAEVVVVTTVDVEADVDAADAGDDEGAGKTMVWAGCNRTGAGSSDGEATVYVTALAGGGDANPRVKVRRIARLAKSDADQERGWLGIAIGLVDDALAAQLDVKDRGVMVLNVVAESPAERAGLQVHDIVLSVDGDALDGEDADGRVARFVDLIGSHAPGDTVNIAILREGQEVSVTPTLGSRSDTNALTWIFQHAPDTELIEKIHTIGKICRRGPNGEWIIEDLGDLKGLGDLSEDIRKLILPGGCRSMQVSVDGNRASIKCTIERDGERLTVEQEDDGEITVRRVDADGNETTKTYAGEDELGEADEEAFELYKNAAKQHVIHLNIDSGELDDLDFKFNVDIDDLTSGHVFEWKTQLEDSLESASETYNQGMEELHEVMEQLHEVMEHWKGGGQEGLLQKLHGSRAPFLELAHLGKPKHTFELREDGTIEIRIRKGDSELVQLYTDEDDLALRNPRLSKKYQELMNAGE